MGAMKCRFIVDVNVGSLAKRLRMLGYDTRFIRGIRDDEIIRAALKDERIILTRDTRIMKRRIVTTEAVKAILILSDQVKEQLYQVVSLLELKSHCKPFTRCMENGVLQDRDQSDICDLVPPYVYKTQEYYRQCPECERVYWKGTHWKKMFNEISALRG